jgi:hypothetical protein
MYRPRLRNHHYAIGQYLEQAEEIFFSPNPMHWSDATSSSTPTASRPAPSSKLLQSQVATTEVEEQEEEDGGSDGE